MYSHIHSGSCVPAVTDSSALATPSDDFTDRVRFSLK